MKQKTLTKTKVNNNMELRRHLFQLARKGDKRAINFLWETFKFRIIPKEEAKEHIKNCKHCKQMLNGERMNGERMNKKVRIIPFRFK